MGAFGGETFLVDGEMLPTLDITPELIQQVREVLTMKSTSAEKILPAKWA